MKKKKTKELTVRKYSMLYEILIPAIIIILVLGTAIGMGTYRKTETQMIKMGVEEADMAASFAKDSIHADYLTNVDAGFSERNAYTNLLNSLIAVRKKCGIKYIYLLYTDKKKVYYALDADNTKRQHKCGDEYREPYENLKIAFDGKDYGKNIIEHNSDGDLISTYRPIRNSNNDVVAVLGCDYDAEYILHNLAGIRNFCIFLVVVGVVVSIVILYLITKRIIGGITLVNGKLYELVHADGDLTKQLEISSGNETEVTAGLVNGMLHFIKDVIVSIAGNSEKIASSSENVANQITLTKDDVSGVSAVMQQMSASMEETSASLCVVTDNMNKIFLTTKEIADEANAHGEKAEKISSRARKVAEAAYKEQKSAMQQAQELIEQINEKIKQSKAVEQINELTGNIIDISEQTNLLSLNASIEAARAGEAGKGFAVVANEVGSLAATSADTAEKISQVSQAVIVAVNELAESSEKMLGFLQKVLDHGYEELIDTSKSYQTDVEDMTEVMKHFAEESRKLNNSLDEIKDSINDISIAVDESAKGVSDVAETSATINQHMESVGKEITSNRHIAKELQKEVHKFKI